MLVQGCRSCLNWRVLHEHELKNAEMHIIHSENTPGIQIMNQMFLSEEEEARKEAFHTWKGNILFFSRS